MPRLHRGYEGHEPVSRQSSVIFASTPSADARRTPRLAYSTFVFGHAALRPPSRPSVLDPTSSQPQLFSHSPVRSSALVSVDDLARGPSGDSFPGSKPPRSRNRLSTPNMLCVPSVRPAIHSISDAPGVNGEPTSGRRDRELVDHLIAAT